MTIEELKALVDYAVNEEGIDGMITLEGNLGRLAFNAKLEGL